MRIWAWILGILIALNVGGAQPKETDDELRSKIQSHIDVIVDESAAIIDDVAESIRSNERLQDADQKLADAAEVAQDTAAELEQVLESAGSRMRDIFGADECAEEPAEE